MLERIISGGQTGADLAAWRAARRFSIPTGGAMPKGWLTEAGPRPDFADLYGAEEHPSPNYAPRTRTNVEWADLTIVFDASGGRSLEKMSRGTQLAIRTAMEYERPSFVVVVDLDQPVMPSRPQAMADRIAEHGYRVINCAGNRESAAPGIGAWVENYLVRMFTLLGFKEQ